MGQDAASGLSVCLQEKTVSADHMTLALKQMIAQRKAKGIKAECIIMLHGDK